MVTLPITYKQAHLQCFATVAQQSEAGISAYNLTLSTVSIIAGGGYNKRYLSIGINNRFTIAWTYSTINQDSTKENFYH